MPLCLHSTSLTNLEFVPLPLTVTGGPTPVLPLAPAGAAGVQFVPLAAGPGGPWGAVYGGLPSPAALLVARVVREVHLHSYHSS